MPNAEERVRSIAKSYVESPDNASRCELNVAVRQELKATGAVASEDHTFRVLVQRQDMTGAERSCASPYESNDVVPYSRRSKPIALDPATYPPSTPIHPPPTHP